MVRFSLRRALVGVATVWLMVGAFAAGARADDYTVGTTGDPTAAASATGSLRQIIAYIHAHPFPPDTITVPAGTYTLNAGLGSLVINDSMSIIGAGARSTVIAMPVPADRTTMGSKLAISWTSQPARARSVRQRWRKLCVVSFGTPARKARAREGAA